MTEDVYHRTFEITQINFTPVNILRIFCKTTPEGDISLGEAQSFLQKQRKQI